MIQNARPDGKESIEVVVGDHVLDLRARRLHDRNGRRIELRAQSMRVLVFLAEREGAVATKDEILDACWPGLTVTEDSLTQCISDIRRVLGPNGRDAIRTEPRRGYWAIVAKRPLAAASPPETPPAVAAGVAGPERRPRRAPWVVAMAAVLIIAAGLAWIFSLWGREPVERDAGRSSTLVAVLPFDNMAGDPGLGYVVEGTTEYLMASLARSPDIRVIGGAPVTKAAGHPLDPKSVGAQLGAAYLLTGSVERSPDRLRIVAELVDARTGEHVWANRYDKAGTDPFGLQDDVVMDIVRTVTGDMGVIYRHE